MVNHFKPAGNAQEYLPATSQPLKRWSHCNERNDSVISSRIPEHIGIRRIWYPFSSRGCCTLIIRIFWSLLMLTILVVFLRTWSQFQSDLVYRCCRKHGWWQYARKLGNPKAVMWYRQVNGIKLTAAVIATTCKADIVKRQQEMTSTTSGSVEGRSCEHYFVSKEGKFSLLIISEKLL